MLTLTKNKKFFGLIMLIFTILAFYYTTYAVVSPKTNFYVNDYADVLSEETENYILNSNIGMVFLFFFYFILTYIWFCKYRIFYIIKCIFSFYGIFWGI